MDAALDGRLRAALALPEDGAPVGSAVRVLLSDAAAAGASDVHLNPTPAGLEVVYRVDGALLRAARIEASRAERFVGRLKVLAGLPTYRRDVPQDGSIPAAEAAGRSDVRISTFPTIHGERAVLRFFLEGADRLDLDALALPAPIPERLRSIARRPEGLVLLTGPAGSGKTTTIYALLREIVRAAAPAMRHVVTIEDPVERVLEGVTQAEVNPDAGITFGSALRSLLRHDPQVIMVGEIRDRETARVAAEAGLTGHLVISTVHAGSAAGVVVRLLEMGVEPHVLNASLACIVAQRLLRRYCRDAAPGCPACRGTGFSGRVPVAEILEATDALREAIARGPSRAEVESIAAGGGMIPLRDAAARLVSEGVATGEEVRRVLG